MFHCRFTNAQTIAPLILVESLDDAMIEAGSGKARSLPRSLGIQVGKSRSTSDTLGPKVGATHT